MEIEVHEKQYSTKSEWKLVTNFVKDLAWHNDHMCKSITLAFINQDSIPQADTIILAYQNIESRRKFVKQYNGLIVLQKHDNHVLYIDLICAKGAGKFLIEQAKLYAIQNKFQFITLSALSNVIGFYRNLGFKNTESFNCREPDNVQKASQNIDPKSIGSNTDFLNLLVKNKLVKNKACKNLNECSVDGFSMTYCV